MTSLHPKLMKKYTKKRKDTYFTTNISPKNTKKYKKTPSCTFLSTYPLTLHIWDVSMVS